MSLFGTFSNLGKNGFRSTRKGKSTYTDAVTVVYIGSSLGCCYYTKIHSRV